MHTKIKNIRWIPVWHEAMHEQKKTSNLSVTLYRPKEECGTVQAVFNIA